MPPRTDPPSGEPGPAAVEPPRAMPTAILLAGGRGSRLGGVEKALLHRGEQTQIQRWVHALQRRDIRTVVVGPASLKPRIPATVPLVREVPAFGGPAAGVFAGAVELHRLLRGDTLNRDTGLEGGPDPHPGAEAAPSGWTLLLAVDLTEPAPLLDWLLGQLGQLGQLGPLGPGEDALHRDAAVDTAPGAAPTTGPPGEPTAVLPCDEGGRPQYLSAAVPTGWLLRRVAQLTAAEVEHRPLRWLLRGLLDDVQLRRPVVPGGLTHDVDTLHDAHRLGLELP